MMILKLLAEMIHSVPTVLRSLAWVESSVAQQHLIGQLALAYQVRRLPNDARSHLTSLLLA